ncbi:hypothetical protein APSETT445_009255 [Aspergillus pseudonomiae]
MTAIRIYSNSENSQNTIRTEGMAWYVILNMIQPRDPREGDEELIKDGLCRLEYHPPKPMWLQSDNLEGVQGDRIILLVSYDTLMPSEDDVKGRATEKLNMLLKIEQGNS